MMASVSPLLSRAGELRDDTADRRSPFAPRRSSEGANDGTRADGSRVAKDGRDAAEWTHHLAHRQFEFCPAGKGAGGYFAGVRWTERLERWEFLCCVGGAGRLHRANSRARFHPRACAVGATGQPLREPAA